MCVVLERIAGERGGSFFATPLLFDTLTTLPFGPFHSFHMTNVVQLSDHVFARLGILRTTSAPVQPA